jgi:hypothetical protein
MNPRTVPKMNEADSVMVEVLTESLTINTYDKIPLSMWSMRIVVVISISISIPVQCNYGLSIC